MYEQGNDQFIQQLSAVIRYEVQQALEQNQAVNRSQLHAHGDNFSVRRDDDNLVLEPRNEVREDGVLTAVPAIANQVNDHELHKERLVFTNPWVRIRWYLREPFAECIGTFMLVFFGTAVNCQVNVSAALLGDSSAKGNWLSDCFAWGVGIGLGAWFSGGITGGHINPGTSLLCHPHFGRLTDTLPASAVTLAMAAFRKFPLRKVLVYWAAQVLGGLLAALVTYSIYCNPIRMVDPEQTQKTASNFATFPAGSWLESPSTRISTWWNECFGTMILVMTVFAVGDSANNPPPNGMAPLVLLFMLAGLAMAIGWQTAFAFNPARDFGPRLAMWIVGYPKHVLWTRDAWYWIWTPIIGPLSGGLFGALIYDAFLYTGSESWLNAPWFGHTLPENESHWTDPETRVDSLETSKDLPGISPQKEF